MVSLDVRVIAFGTSDGVVGTIKVDSLEAGPTMMQCHRAAVTSLVQSESSLVSVGADSSISWCMVENLAEVGQMQVVSRVKSPIELYGGECVFSEGKLVTFSKDGAICMWVMSEDPYPSLIEFLEQSEYPEDLKPRSRTNTKILVQTQAPSENIAVFLLNAKGEAITESREGVVFEEKREEKQFFYIDLDTAALDGLWRVGARLQNTEMLKQKQPRFYYISAAGVRQFALPSQIPQSKRQVLNWFVGTLVPDYQHLKTTNFYTSDAVFTKFPSLELTLHTGKLNAIKKLTDTEFLTAADDRQVVVWNALTFQPFQVLPDAHSSEVVSLYRITDKLFSTGAKDGDVALWAKADQFNWRKTKDFRHHDKAVYDMITLDNNLYMVTCSDDRKLNVVNLKTLALECSETVDRTFVISLAKFQKDSFAGGFPDGRVKIWKKEKSANKIILKNIRTFTSQKVQHINLFTNNLLFVGGAEKLAEVFNLNDGTKLK